MQVGLFIPCYIDQFYPQVGIATLELLEKLGCEVVFPANQTCCGQPMANSGYESLDKGCDTLFAANFAGCDYIVGPTGSCVLHIKHHIHSGNKEMDARISSTIFELTEFMTDILKVESLPAKFPHKIGLHQSCHGQRGLHLAQMSELVAEPFSKPLHLLKMVQGAEMITLGRTDECCGFGGTFCVFEEAVSAKMGKDRVADHQKHGVEVITGTDVSCLMHMEGIIRREKLPVRVMHIAEILNSN
jgi:L-lactate dehydrogenase complex protein LldE